MSAEIPLTRGMVAIVDDDDAEWLERYSWNAQPAGRFNFYAGTCVLVNGRMTTVRMHRIIVHSVPEGMVTDHVNGNGLDNRRCNLRIITYSQNRLNQRRTGNRSGIKGISWHNRDLVWRATFLRKHLGSFRNQQDALRAYEQAARAIGGDVTYVWGD